MKKTEYDKGYDDGWDRGVNTGCLSMAAIMVAVIVIGSLMFFYGDRQDRINTAEYGKILCEQYNLEYSHRTLITQESGGEIPKIYCKKPTIEREKKLLDNLVVME